MRKVRIHLGDLVFDVDFKLGEFVYLRTRDDTTRGQVTGYDVQPGILMYSVCWAPDCTERRHYGFELSTSPFVQDTEEEPDLEETEGGAAT